MANIIVTGGSRGLGLSHAKYLADKGHSIAIVDISTSANGVYDKNEDSSTTLEALLKENSNSFFACDLTDCDQTISVFKEITRRFESIDGLVCNAGGDVVGRDRQASGGKARDNNIAISISDHDAVFDRNYKTTLHSLKAIIPYFKAQRSGRIVTTSSVSASFGVDQETAYSISKAAVAQLSRSAARELREYGVNVNCIAPGATLTGRFIATIKNRSKEDQEKIYAESLSHLTKPAIPENISSVVEFLLSDQSTYISGQVIRIDGGQFTFPC